MDRRLIAAWAAALLLAGCGAQGDGSMAQRSATAPMAEMAKPEAAGGAAMASDAPAPAPQKAMPRKIVYTAEMNLVTDDLDKAGAALEAKVKVAGGYVGNASRSGVRGEARTATWTIRVPADRYDSFVAGLPTLGELESSSRKADDVSEEFYDVAARLKNKKVEEARLVDLLQKATGRLTEVLTVEKELSRVREEVERIEGRLRFLTNQTDLATVTVTLREVKNYVPEGPPTLATRLSRSWSGSIDAMKEFAIGLLVAGVAILPWILPLGLVIWVLVRLLKKGSKK